MTVEPSSVYIFLLIPQVLNYNPVLGAFLIGSCIVFMTFVVLNLFISVILVAFSQEQIHHKVTHTMPSQNWVVTIIETATHCSLTYISLFLQPSEEDEIVDLMLMKLCSLFGLKFKQQGGDCLTERPDVSSVSNNGLSMISSGNSCDG